ncbi:HAMP domain-containing histidine kinase [Aquabacter sp. L1I39]|uniref:sensor histidine kinase n=1 Tax=Aquabacter sp. L1I39 TaxID=2820278 RepID=UPI001ADB7F28|nr:HAMP domain-containing sensor histidine kinase [Aquabacter sp. L1I39]QTL02315.1 HAMP domain-containing histidine kinase [Aquabacter sp. L1I39]
MDRPLPSGDRHALPTEPVARAHDPGFPLPPPSAALSTLMLPGLWATAAVAAVAALGAEAEPGARLLLGCAAGALAVAAATLHRLRARSTALASQLERCRRQAEETLSALRQAEGENAAKSRFLAEMSHELRTPLNSVIGFSEMMADEVLGPHSVPAYRGYARDIHSSGRHLLALADDILDLARIETGHRTLLETAVSLGPLLEDCAHMMRLSAADRGVRLSVGDIAGAPRLWADERAMRQITLNLLANAVKFTPAGGMVRLSSGVTAAGEPCVCVDDTGPGIGDAELPLTGAARSRESATDPVSGRGAGLGLAIVRGLADLHGARLTLARRAEGGTRAEISFPAARRLPPRAGA